MPKQQLLTFDDLEIGDIVDFITKSSQIGLTETKIVKDNVITIYKHGQNKMFPPSMVVIEVVQEDLKHAHLIDERTGLKKKDSVKVLCQWYSERNSKFNERWFNIGVLQKNYISKSKEKKNLSLNQCVCLKTFVVSNNNTSKILKGAIQSDNKEIEYTITRKYDNLFFLPPMMYITSIEELSDKEKKPLFHKTIKEKQIRKCSNKKIKCIWFDYLSGKFSENYFSPEVLMIPEIEEGIDDFILSD